MLHPSVDTARPGSRTEPGAIGATPDWRTGAIAVYGRAEPDDTGALRTELASRLRALIGRRFPPGAIQVDRDGRVATAVVDGTRLRLRRHDLLLVRPCAHCGTGDFESPPLLNLVDLGQALAAWEPRCRHCQIEDPNDLASW
jgi:hypothetical protein